MNRNKLKAYAPKARREFIKAVTDRAAFYGLTKDKIEPITERGDVAIIGGKPFPIDVAKKRKRLEERIRREGFGQVMEAMAYTWFNRFVAIRYMEVHGYLEHGYRVLSATPVEYPHVPSSGATGQAGRGPGSTGRANSTNDTNKGGTVSGFPEILVYAEHVDLPGLDQEKVVELKLAGNRDEELYRMLLIAQCNALHKAMPFLFERIGDATELLLPENLLHSDSLIRKMVSEIPEEEWEEVEIIGWLYQFYISEKKDQVIGKVVKSEDIPAATQLFTPNWIVKYMVQNTLGRQWVATYPNSPLKRQMEYYIEPADQTPEAEELLKSIMPESLNPEELTLLDPACGSGHILVEAYDLLKAIYQERGYRAKDIPKLILEKNLYGLEIDDRAAQLAAFTLMMKARADDRRIFENGTRPHVLAIENNPGLSDDVLQVFTTDYTDKTDKNEYAVSVSIHDMRNLLKLFEHGKTFGSLIRVPEKLADRLPHIFALVEHVLAHGDMFEKAAAEALRSISEQAALLLRKYDCVVTNPPYMGSKGMNPDLKEFAKLSYPDSKSDLFAMFIERAKQFGQATGYVGLITPYVWMFLLSYEKLRKQLIDDATITTLDQLEYNAFQPACIPVCTFVFYNSQIRGYKGSFIKLSEFKGHQNQAPRTLEAIRNLNCGWFYRASATDFKKIPSSPIAYWVSENQKSLFKYDALKKFAVFKEGLTTANNHLFLRIWSEIEFSKIAIGVSASNLNIIWAPYNKGGSFRRWYGNNFYVVDWRINGDRIKKYPGSSFRNSSFHFRRGSTFSALSSGLFSVRYSGVGFSFDSKGTMLFSDKKLEAVTIYLNSKVCRELLKLVAPTLDFRFGTIQELPYLESNPVNFDKLVYLGKSDWDSYENSWDFTELPLLSGRWAVGSGPKEKLTTRHHPIHATLGEAYARLRSHWRGMPLEMKRLEEENNRIFIEAYGLQDELTPDVPISEITLTCNPHYRYGGDKSDEELEELLLTDTIKELISYTIGCMMGRYSLDQPGLIYAHSGNDQFREIYHEKHNKPTPPQNKNHSCDSWSTFSPDQDGIIPITDTDWFPDDAANRFNEFISVAWPKEHLEENLKFAAESLGPKRSESPRETIRRYISTGFFKHHMKMYKKRPIYWLFSSGNLRAFQCLVYLHRYNEGTLSRMRTEYVIPLQGKISARIEQLSGDINAATSTAHRKKLERERDKLVKQQVELQTFDEKLRHYADQRISLDLDDGVKVNYGKFGDLLAEVKAVTGKKKK